MITKILTLVIFGLAAVVGVWDLLQIQAFDNALIQFATAGVVPGTHVALSPGQMFVVLSCILLLVICLLFHRGIARDVRGLHTLLSQPVRRPHKKPVAPEAASEALQHAPRVTEGNEVVIVTTIPGTPGLVSQAVRYVRPRLLPALRYAGRHVARAIIVCDRESRVWAVAAWRAAEPRIRAWDAAIERWVKQRTAIARPLEAAGRDYAAARSYIEGWRTKSRRAVEK